MPDHPTRQTFVNQLMHHAICISTYSHINILCDNIQETLHEVHKVLLNILHVYQLVKYSMKIALGYHSNTVWLHETTITQISYVPLVLT